MRKQRLFNKGPQYLIKLSTFLENQNTIFMLLYVRNLIQIGKIAKKLKDPELLELCRECGFYDKTTLNLCQKIDEGFNMMHSIDSTINEMCTDKKEKQ